MKQLYCPFEQLGNVLRSLSLSGGTGNMAALIIYGVICLIPCMIFLWLKRKKCYCKSDVFLPILSALLFVVIYYLINPTLFMANAPWNSSEMGALMLVSLFYIVLTGYLIFRGIECCMSPDVKKLQKGLKILLYSMILVLILSTIVELFINLPEAIRVLKEGNQVSSTWPEAFIAAPDLAVTILFLALQSVVKVIPYIFEMVIVGMLIRLVHELGVDRYSEKVARILEIIGRVCVQMLVTTIIVHMVFAVLQVICRNMLYQVNMDISIPVLPMIFVLAVLLISRYVRETQKMKEELDMFI